MNDQVLERAQAAYRAGDFATAAQMFSAAKDAGEVSGEIDHLRGNSLMRLGRYAEAASAYAAALSDASYGKRGALLTNQGKALAASGDLNGAVSSFTAATQDASYATTYKAYLGLGNALQQLGNMTDAGVAFRQAAIDGTNPAPAGALASLGACFVALDRPEDAIEAYRTALDFVGPRDDARGINAGLGQAYAAANRLSDAVDAFTRATSDGIYQLTAEQQSVFDHAQETLSANSAMSVFENTGNGYVNGVDPLDPLGQSGNFMPDPSDTGFFDISESEMIKNDRRNMKVRRKHRHVGLKIFLFILFLLVVLGGAGAFLFTQGMGYPTQEDAITDLFKAASDGTDASPYLVSDMDDAVRNTIVNSIPKDAKPTISQLDKSMMESTAKVSVDLGSGRSMDYDVKLARQGIGWVVSSVVMDLGDSAASSDASLTEDNAANASADGGQNQDEAQDQSAPASNEESAE